MQKRMREIQQLKAAGKTEEAEKKMEEMRRQMTALRSRGPGRDSDGGPGRGPDRERPGEGDRQGPPSRGDRPDGDQDRKPGPPSRDAKPGDSRRAGPDRTDDGPDREILAMMREKAGDKMREIQKLREAGKHEEANKRMAEMRKYFEAAREKMANAQDQRGGPGPGSPWAKRDSDEGKHDEAAKRMAERKEHFEAMREKKGASRGPKGPGPGQGPRPGLPWAKGDSHDMREKAGEKMREIMKLRQDGKHDEANRRMAEMKKHFEAMRRKMAAAHGPKGPGQGHGPAWARKDGHDQKAKPQSSKKKASPTKQKSKSDDDKRKPKSKDRAKSKDKAKASAAPGKKKGPKKSRQAGKREGKGDSRARHHDSRKRSPHGRQFGKGRDWSPWARSGARPGAARHFQANRFAQQRMMMMKRWAEARKRLGDHRGSWRGERDTRSSDHRKRDSHDHARKDGPEKSDSRKSDHHHRGSAGKGDHDGKGGPSHHRGNRESDSKVHGKERGSERKSD